MKKDRIRGYATEAFRYWASVGCPTYDEAVERIKRRAEAKAKGQPAEIRAAFVAACIDNRIGALLDIKACDECFRYFDAHGKECVCSAVRAVYMAFPKKRLARGELSGRAVRFAMDNYYSDRWVYKFLDEACERFAEYRCLRQVDGDDLLMCK